MREITVHRVDGVGRPRTYAEDQPFNPEVHERAVHGLQDTVLKLARLDANRPIDDYDPGHKHDEEDGQQVIHVQPDTLLHKICKQIVPRYWDVSVVTDLIRETSYGVRASVSCGDGYLVEATIFIDQGMVRRFDVAHTGIADPEEREEVTSLCSATSSRELMHLNRWLERTVMAGYAKTIPSAATAFDYIATRDDIPPSGERTTGRRNRRERVFQKEWASIRGKTQQTVSDNVRAARDHLWNLPDINAFKESRPALTELDEDADYEPGDIRLV